MVPCFLQLPYHLASNSLALFLSFSLSLLFCRKILRTISYVVDCCRGCLAITDNLSDNLAITMCCTRSTVSIALETKWKDINATWKDNACKWKEDERTWMHIGMNMKGIWKENEQTWIHMNGTWKEINCRIKGTCMQMKGTWKEMNATWKDMNAKWKQHDLLPKHLKPTKQLLDRFPSLFRNGFWFHVGSRICWFLQNLGKR